MNDNNVCSPETSVSNMERNSDMPERKGHKTESDVEPEAHESRSRATDGEEDDTYVGATGPDDAFDAGETGAEARSQKR